MCVYQAYKNKDLVNIVNQSNVIVLARNSISFHAFFTEKWGQKCKNNYNNIFN